APAAPGGGTKTGTVGARRRAAHRLHRPARKVVGRQVVAAGLEGEALEPRLELVVAAADVKGEDRRLRLAEEGDGAVVVRGVGYGPEAQVLGQEDRLSDA